MSKVVSFTHVQSSVGDADFAAWRGRRGHAEGQKDELDGRPTASHH